MAVHSGDTSISKANNSKKLSPINILSVDFDWIMEPSIEVYNGFVTAPSYPWPEIYKDCPGIRLDCDMNKYQQLALYLGNIIAKLPDYTHFFYDRSHDGIVNSCKKWNIGMQDYNLFNIDHHHDCGYPKRDDMTYEELMNPLNCSNWVLHMVKEYPNCKGYTWICNKNSKNVVPDLCMPHLPNVYQTADLNMINYVNIDYVFLCKSEEWVPPEYYPLYDSLTHLLEKIAIK